jgi:hypothetical protein
VGGTVCVEAAAETELAFGSKLRSEVENSIATVIVTVTAIGLRLVDGKTVWRRGCGGQSLWRCLDRLEVKDHCVVTGALWRRESDRRSLGCKLAWGMKQSWLVRSDSKHRSSLSAKQRQRMRMFQPSPRIMLLFTQLSNSDADAANTRIYNSAMLIPPRWIPGVDC